MRVLLTDPLACTDEFERELARACPSARAYRWPALPEDKCYEVLLAWRLPPDIDPLPDAVRAVFCFGAGADHLLADPRIPASLPIARLLDQEQAVQLLDYAAHVAFARLTNHQCHHANQQQTIWSGPGVPKTRRSELRIVVLGLGAIGETVATGLASLGFSTAAWSRRRRQLPGIQTFGAGDLGAAVTGADVLVNLLPLAAGTEHILGRPVFDLMSPGAYVANLGRGGHLREADLRDALDSGRVASAWLDVFEVEPLPQEHWFWHDPRIHVTPHIGGLPTPAGAARSLAAVIEALGLGMPLPGLVRAGSRQPQSPKDSP